VSDTDPATNRIHSTGSSDGAVSSERDQLQLIIAALEQNNPASIWEHFFNDLRPAAELLEPRLINAAGFLSGSGPTLIYPSSHQPPDPTQFDFVLAVSS
ncbi:MAG: hypothetical protein LBC43_03320, partial [Bifidobacteriaceae bacterium]|nr:hypothetical protein [Bifidobacteriaceae bacterium]